MHPILGWGACLLQNGKKTFQLRPGMRRSPKRSAHNPQERSSISTGSTSSTGSHTPRLHPPHTGRRLEHSNHMEQRQQDPRHEPTHPAPADSAPRKRSANQELTHPKEQKTHGQTICLDKRMPRITCSTPRCSTKCAKSTTTIEKSICLRTERTNKPRTSAAGGPTCRAWAMHGISTGDTR